MEATELVCRMEPKPDTIGEWWIFGLNIFRYNRPSAVDQWVPFVSWLSCFLDDQPTAALLGGCAIQDLGLPETPGIEAIEVDTTLLGGDFYSFKESFNNVPGVFYPQIEPSLLPALLEYARYDALVIMAGIQDAGKIRVALDSFTSKVEVRDRLRELAQWVILSRGDAQYLEVYSNRPDTEAGIRCCCEVADRAVREVPWFQEVMPRLFWDDTELCYRLPKPDKK